MWADQGVGGITISTSKGQSRLSPPLSRLLKLWAAALYTLGAGINPNRILPVVLDVGTDNHALFADKLYMGWKRTRLRGKNYDAFVKTFLDHCRDLFPSSIIHFEDVSLIHIRMDETLTLWYSLVWPTLIGSWRNTRIKCQCSTMIFKGRELWH